MKTPLFALLILGASLATASWQAVRADDGTNSGTTNLAAGPNGGTGDNAQGERRGHLREALAQLDLTDAQKAQIKQIWTSTSPGKERRHQIFAVLTPDQKAKLKEMIEKYRSQHQDGDETADTPSAN